MKTREQISIERKNAAVDTTPRIYVACLASYNAGILHGRWIDCDQGVEHINDEVAAMLKQSTQQFAEEWAVHDHQFMGPITESTDFDTCAEIGEAVSTAQDSDAFLAWLDNQNIMDITAGIAAHMTMDFEESYYGTFDNESDFAYDFFVDQLEEVPASLSCHIDWDSVWNDLRCGDFYSVYANGNYYIFRS